ncbi:MAG: MFS transporter [Candidatus Pacebacteria bacterium]|nr:MFS transporter [Candidatus Paceibacterota bacterium]
MSWKRTFIFAFFAQFLGIVGISFATPFLPFFVGELGVSESGAQAFWAGIVLGSGAVAYAVFAPVWGILADRVGRKAMVCRAMFGAAIAVLLMSFAQTVPQMILFRVVQGIFSGTLAASIALVASVTPLHRSGLALGMMQAAVFIGNAVGPLIGGMAADMFGYRVSFRIGALLTLLGGVLVLFGTAESFTPPDENESVNTPGFRKIFLLPGFLVSVLILFSVRLSNSIANPSFPLIVEDILGSLRNLNSITGSVIGAAAIAAAVSAALLGHAGDRLGRRRVLVGCCIAACLASVGHYFARNLPSLFCARILFGFSMAGMLPAANAMIHEVVDRRSIGKAYGLATALSMLGTAFGPTIGGTLAMQAGLRIPFLVTAAAQVGLVIMVLFMFRDHRCSPHKRETFSYGVQ